MEREFILYDDAIAMKELGFDEPCFAHFVMKDNAPLRLYSEWLSRDFWKGKHIVELDIINERFMSRSVNKRSESAYWKKVWKEQCLAPTYHQAFRWFRDKYDITVSINRNRKYKSLTRYEVKIDKKTKLEKKPDRSTKLDFDIYFLDYCDTYEESELQCLKHLIDVAKKLKHES
ncbi:MAG TPA: hypothetical protein VNX68_04235 [Nitrosopumilaceae archaeon]|jgi:hypothetical protein|nr:hypothetical protein [Nitrosopumilaceae archaeon]